MWKLPPQLKAFSHRNCLSSAQLYKAIFMRATGGREEVATLLTKNSVLAKFVDFTLISETSSFEVLCPRFWVSIAKSSKFLVAFLILTYFPFQKRHFLMVGTFYKAYFVMRTTP